MLCKYSYRISHTSTVQYRLIFSRAFGANQHERALFLSLSPVFAGILLTYRPPTPTWVIAASSLPLLFVTRVHNDIPTRGKTSHSYTFILVVSYFPPCLLQRKGGHVTPRDASHWPLSPSVPHLPLSTNLISVPLSRYISSIPTLPYMY